VVAFVVNGNRTAVFFRTSSLKLSLMCNRDLPLSWMIISSCYGACLMISAHIGLTLNNLTFTAELMGPMLHLTQRLIALVCLSLFSLLNRKVQVYVWHDGAMVGHWFYNWKVTGLTVSHFTVMYRLWASYSHSPVPLSPSSII